MKNSIFLVIICFCSLIGSAQKMVDALVIDYKIEIEAGRDPKRPDVRPESIVVYNRMYVYNNRAVYLKLDSTKKWSDFTQEEKSVLWKKGKTSYRYEYKDSNCCVLYSNMKERYKTDNTVIEEEILGRKTKKEIVMDNVNQRTYLVWTDHGIKLGLSPLGFMPVSGLVMRLRNENMVYEVVSISTQKVDESFFEVDTDVYHFTEKAFRAGVIE